MPRALTRADQSHDRSYTALMQINGSAVLIRLDRAKLGSCPAHTQGVQRAFFYVLGIALARRRHGDNRFGDEFPERLISVNQLQVINAAS